MALSLSEYGDHDGLSLGELVASRRVSAGELAQTALQAIAKLNPALNAVVRTMGAEATAAIAANRSATVMKPLLFMNAV